MRRSFDFSRQELIELVREVAAEGDGENLTLRRFRQATGVPQSVVDKHFGNWNLLKGAAALPRVRKGDGFSDDEALAALHGVVERLWRVPREREFDDLAGMCWQTVRNKFGTLPEVVRAYREWLDERRELRVESGESRDEGRGAREKALDSGHSTLDCAAGGGAAQELQPLGFGGGGERRNVQGRMPDGDRDCGWVREQWEGLRVFFAGRSSEFAAERGAEFDLVVCWEDDARECAVPVVELKSRWEWMGAW